MAKRLPESSSIPDLSAYPTDNASVEAAWREALAIRAFGGSEHVKSRKRLAEAQAARTQAENEAITATKNYCLEVRAQADRTLEQAEGTLADIERMKAAADARISNLENAIQSQLDDASDKRDSARVYAEKLENTARGAADALMSQTRDGAKELASRMRHDAAEDIRKILSDIEVARAAAEDELAAQRLLTETARVKTLTAGLDTEAAQARASTVGASKAAARAKPLRFTAAQQKKSPARGTASAKKRSTRKSSARKAA